MYKTTLRKTDGTEYTVDTYNGLTEQTTTTQSTHAPKEIFYGGVPKTGSMKIDDPQQKIVDKVLDGTFDLSDTTVKTYYNDKLQGVFKTSDSDYEENSGELSVSLVDNINNWDKIPFAGRDYSLRADDSIKPTLYEILSYVLMTTLKWNNSNTVMQADVDTMCSRAISVNMGDTIEDMTVKQYLQRIIIPYDYLGADNLRSTVDKICAVAQLNYAETYESGGVYPKNIRFFNARPAKAKSEKIIVLPPSSQNEFPARDVLLKNKYDGSAIAESVVTSVVEDSVEVFTHTSPIENTTPYNKTASAFDKETFYGTTAQPFPVVVYFGTKMFVTIKYVSVSFKFSKLSNSNLTRIRAAYSGVDENKSPYISFMVMCQVDTGECFAKDVAYNNLNADNVIYNNQTSRTTKKTVEEKYSAQISRDYIKGETIIGNVSQNVDLSFDYSNIAGATNNTAAYTITEDEDYYYVNDLLLPVGYSKSVLSSVFEIGTEQMGAANVPAAKNTSVNWSGDFENITPKSVDITIRGKKTTISFENANSKQNTTAQNIYTYSDINLLLQNTAFVASYYKDSIGAGIFNVTLTVADITKKYSKPDEVLATDYQFDKNTGTYKFSGGAYSFKNLPLNTPLYGKTDYGIDAITIIGGSYSSGAYTMNINTHYATYTPIEPITTHIANSILSDYANGVSTCSVETTLDMLYDTDGNVAKHSSDGEILNVGDIVRIDRNSFGESIYNYVDGNPYLWRVTGTNLIYDGYPHQKLELQEITSGNRGLKYMSWEMIESIANSGQAQNVFSIGDEKEIELSTGEKLTVVIIGFNHDKISGTKKAGITFMTKTPLQTKYKMSTASNSDWGTCTMRTSTLKTIKSQLPKALYTDDTNTILKMVKKEYYSSSGTLSESEDDLFLLSGAEVDGLSKDTFGLEGTQYQYFIDYGKNIGVSYPGWWTRTLRSTNTKQYMRRVNANKDFITASSTLNVIFAFCIGEVDV